jgi:Rrf2 family protein
LRLELSKKTDYAIRALEELRAREDRLVSGAFLATSVGTSTYRLPQVMQPLLRHGWVESVPGPHGGYRLTADLTQISLLQVIDAVEGSIPVDRCVLRGVPCPNPEPCALHFPWARARETILSEFDSTSVAGG